MLRRILGSIFLIGGIVSAILMLYHLIFMFGCVKPEKKHYATLLGPFSFFIPNLWTEAGNAARLKTFAFASCFGIFFVSLMLVVRFLPLP